MLRTAPVEARTLVTVSEFERYVRPGGVPLIVKGWMADWQALSAWDFDFFGARCGSDVVCIADDGIEPALEVTIAEYVAYLCDRRADSRLRAIERQRNRSRPFYCLSFKPFGDHPDLWDDCHLPPFIADWWPYFDPTFRAAHFPQTQGWVFLAARGSTARLHRDSHHTITWLAQVRGRKELHLFAPDDAEAVYFGAVDPAEPDFENYPRLKEVTARHCILSPGEMLFLPPDWWHHAVALDDSITVSCNFVNHTNFGDYLVAAFGSRLPEVLAKLPAHPTGPEDDPRVRGAGAPA